MRFNVFSLLSAFVFIWFHFLSFSPVIQSVSSLDALLCLRHINLLLSCHSPIPVWLRKTQRHTNQTSRYTRAHVVTLVVKQTHAHTSLRCPHGVAVISSVGLTSFSLVSPISCHYVPLITISICHHCGTGPSTGDEVIIIRQGTHLCFCN